MNKKIKHKWGDRRVILNDDPHSDPVAICVEDNDAERLVDCWNALAGVEGVMIGDLPRLLTDLRAYLINQTMPETAGEDPDLLRRLNSFLGRQ